MGICEDFSKSQINSEVVGVVIADLHTEVLTTGVAVKSTANCMTDIEGDRNYICPGDSRAIHRWPHVRRSDYPNLQRLHDLGRQSQMDMASIDLMIHELSGKVG